MFVVKNTKKITLEWHSKAPAAYVRQNGWWADNKHIDIFQPTERNIIFFFCERKMGQKKKKKKPNKLRFPDTFFFFFFFFSPSYQQLLAIGVIRETSGCTNKTKCVLKVKK